MTYSKEWCEEHDITEEENANTYYAVPGDILDAYFEISDWARKQPNLSPEIKELIALA